MTCVAAQVLLFPLLSWRSEEVVICFQAIHEVNVILYFQLEFHISLACWLAAEACVFARVLQCSTLLWQLVFVGMRHEAMEGNHWNDMDFCACWILVNPSRKVGLARQTWTIASAFLQAEGRAGLGRLLCVIVYTCCRCVYVNRLIQFLSFGNDSERFRH